MKKWKVRKAKMPLPTGLMDVLNKCGIDAAVAAPKPAARSPCLQVDTYLINSGSDPPNDWIGNVYLCPSGTDPPWESEVRIRSPA